MPPHMDKSNWGLRGFKKKEKPQPITFTDEEWEEKKRKDLEEEKRMRKQIAIGILENDPELIQEILIELRKKKIKKIKKQK
jgi:predicted NUDIX family phosphoesterase